MVFVKRSVFWQENFKILQQCVRNVTGLSSKLKRFLKDIQL